VTYPGVPLDIDHLVLAPDTPDMTELAQYTGAVPAMSLYDSEPGLQDGDMEKLKLMWERLDTLAQRAQENG
jgi:hypothetical protein